ncbi:hypothetical protein [Glycomyces tarimensis]
MAVKGKHREQVKALATGNTQAASSMNEALPAEERAEFNQFVSAVFAVLMERRFKDNLSRDSLAAFAIELCRNYENTGVQLKALTVEGILRGSAGETHLLEGIVAEDIIGTQVLAVAKISAEDPLVRSDIDQFLDDAEELVEQWEREGR